MKPHNKQSQQQSGPDQLNPMLKPNFFQRTSAALNPFSFFHLSGLSALSKPKQDIETGEMTKQELMDIMGNDTDVKKLAEANGTTIGTTEEFGPDPEVLRTKAARLPFEKQQKKEKRKKIGIILGVLAIVAVIAVGTVVAISGGGDGEGDGEGGNGKGGGNGVVTTAPTDSPTAGPFRITDVEDQEKLCEEIFKSQEFDFDDRNQLVFAVCQPDEGRSVFTCRGNGEGRDAGLCEDFSKFCPCEPGLVVNATTLKNFGEVCADEADNNVTNPVCIELEGDLTELLAATNAPTNAPTRSPTPSPTVTQQDS